MLKKILCNKNDFVPDYKNIIGKKITVPGNKSLRSIQALQVDLYNPGGYVLTHNVAYDVDCYIEGNVTKVISINGEPFAIFHHKGFKDRVVEGDDNVSIPSLLENGGVFNSLLTHLYQRFKAITTRKAVIAL